MDMDKDVLIAIKGMQELDGLSGEGDELVTPGTYSMDGNIARFSYMESELTGMEGTKTTFEVRPSHVSLIREGTVNAQMIFEQGKKHFFMYETPFGAFTMGVSTNSIKSKMNDSGGDIEIRCMIDMENSVISRNVFKINVRETPIQ
jgi:uncharacterized beta-barrel protein YwiB (DUF1934 family)